jgi:hypothetical protein
VVQFLSCKPANEVLYGHLPLAAVLFRVLCGNTKRAYDEVGVYPEGRLLESEDEITLLHIFMLTLNEYWRGA